MARVRRIPLYADHGFPGCPCAVCARDRWKWRLSVLRIVLAVCSGVAVGLYWPVIRWVLAGALGVR